jgi:hypothetical protein
MADIGAPGFLFEWCFSRVIFVGCFPWADWI